MFCVSQSYCYITFVKVNQSILTQSLQNRYPLLIITIHLSAKQMWFDRIPQILQIFRFTPTSNHLFEEKIHVPRTLALEVSIIVQFASNFCKVLSESTSEDKSRV